MKNFTEPTGLREKKGWVGAGVTEFGRDRSGGSIEDLRDGRDIGSAAVKSGGDGDRIAIGGIAGEARKTLRTTEKRSGRFVIDVFVVNGAIGWGSVIKGVGVA